MVHQLLWIDAILKFSSGMALLLAPISTARALGLPHGNVGLWPRITGALLIGIAAALYLEGLKLTHFKHGGLGLAGVALINIVGVFSLSALALFRYIQTVRGRLVTWLVVVLLAVLAFLETLAA